MLENGGCLYVEGTPEFESWERVINAALGQVCSELQTARDEAAELNAIFELRHKADMRAIKLWRESTGRELVQPDHADLVVWLEQQLQAAQAELSEVKQALADAAREIPMAGPVANRIRRLRTEHAAQLAAVQEQVRELKSGYDLATQVYNNELAASQREVGVAVELLERANRATLDEILREDIDAFIAKGER